MRAPRRRPRSRVPATSEQFVSPTFDSSAAAIARQISAQAAAIRTDVEANAEIGSALQKSNCTGTVNTQLTQRANGDDEKRVAKLLAGACGDVVRALRAAKAGDTAKAKQASS